MKIGTDVSLMECRASGYLMMEFKRRKLFPKHLNGEMDRDCYVIFSATFAHFSHDENGYIKEPGTPWYKLYRLYDHGLTFNDVVEIYEKYKDEINSMCGLTHEERGLDNPDEYTLLHLASDIDAYCGLE